MAKGFSPLIGLAVVVALAMVAVFGAMSLANPAMAAIGQPGDAELTERVDSPQQIPTFELTATAGPLTVDLSWEIPDGVSADGWRQRNREQGDLAWSVWAPIANDATADGITSGDPVTVSSNGVTYEFEVEGRSGSTRVAKSAMPAFATPGAAANGDTDITSASGDGLNPGQVKVVWTFSADDSGPETPTGWQYSKSATGGWLDIPNSNASTRMHLIEGVSSEATVRIRPVANGVPPANADTGPDGAIASLAVTDLTGTAAFEPSEGEPAENLQYTIKFTPPEVGDTNDDNEIVVAAGSSDIIVKLAQFDVPSSIDDNAVTIQIGNQSRPVKDGSVSVDVHRAIRISLPTGDDAFTAATDAIDAQGNVLEGSGEITVIIRAKAGIKNPTEGKTYSFDDDNKRFVEVEGGTRHYLADFEVIRIIELDPEDGGRGDVTVELTGKWASRMAPP